MEKCIHFNSCKPMFIHMDNACYCGGRYLHCNTKKREIRIMHVVVEAILILQYLEKGDTLRPQKSQ